MSRAIFEGQKTVEFSPLFGTKVKTCYGRKNLPFQCYLQCEIYKILRLLKSSVALSMSSVILLVIEKLTYF